MQRALPLPATLTDYHYGVRTHLFGHLHPLAGLLNLPSGLFPQGLDFLLGLIARLCQTGSRLLLFLLDSPRRCVRLRQDPSRGNGNPAVETKAVRRWADSMDIKVPFEAEGSVEWKVEAGHETTAHACLAFSALP